MSSGPEWQFHIATDISWWRMAILHCYWHLVVQNGNFTLLLTSSGKEWQCHIATDIYWSTMAISHCYWYIVVKKGNFTLLLTSSGQQCQFHIATHVQWSRMTISHCYWHIVVKNGNFTLLLTSSGQEWQFDISTLRVHIGRSTGRSTSPNWAYMHWIRLQQTWHISWQISIYIDNAYTHGRWTPQSIKHKCIEYCYTKLGTSHGRSLYI